MIPDEIVGSDNPEEIDINFKSRVQMNFLSVQMSVQIWIGETRNYLNPETPETSGTYTEMIGSDIWTDIWILDLSWSDYVDIWTELQLKPLNFYLDYLDIHLEFIPDGPDVNQDEIPRLNLISTD